MKKTSLYILVVLLFWSNNTFAEWEWPTADSTCEQLYQIFVHFHLHRQSIAPYTVNKEGNRVVFANGNLQYIAPQKLFSIARNQFDYVGGGNTIGNVPVNYYANPLVPSVNDSISDTYKGSIDLFGWGTSNYHESKDKGNYYYHPYDTLKHNTATNTYGYGPSTNKGLNIDTLTLLREYDWGWHNYLREFSYDIFMHRLDSTMYAKQVWRTPTIAEWQFLFTNNRGVQYGAGLPYTTATISYDSLNPTTVCKGMILFPDSFTKVKANLPDNAFTYEDLTFKPMDHTTWYRLDSVGCTFLPCAGIREGNTTRSVQTEGFYWSSTGKDASEAMCISFTTNGLYTHATEQRHRGLSVRLVQNIDEVYWKRYGH